MKNFFRNTVCILFISALLVVFVEGVASFGSFFKNLPAKEIHAEELHAEYDPLLGWVSKANFTVKDMYGPGKSLTINSQRFRNGHDFDIEVPEGKRRWICLGDSFTLGYGVDDKDSWCEKMSTTLPHIETVNMGQGGYGVDQAFLWYSRDGVNLQHDLLIFAFISDDFYRMTRSTFGKDQKPRLRVVNGEIIQQNVPVPKPGFLSFDDLVIRRKLQNLKMVQAYLYFFGKNDRRVDIKTDQDSAALISAMFGRLQEINEKAGRKVVFAYLPTREDFQGHGSDDLAGFLKSQAEREGWIYFNLIEDLRAMSAADVYGLFIQKDITGFLYSAGHYNERGNQVISDLILKKIAGNPETAPLLSSPALQARGL